MKNLKRILTVLLLFAMTVSCLIPLTACTEDEPPVTECTEHVDSDKDGKCDACGSTVEVNKDPEKGVYTVSIQSLGGIKFSDVQCYIYDKDENIVQKKRTNANGIVSFELPVSDGYKVEVESGDIPDGYKVNDFYDFVGSSAVITLASAPISEGEPPAKYSLGDIIYDYSFETIDGVTLKISDILKEKNMVMLNFWFTTCGPCASEFPLMASAYEKYKDKIEIIAINDHPDPDENLSAVKNYTYEDKDGQYVKLPFPTVKYYGTDLKDALGFNGWPTSVIIDRYGMISIIESGSIANEKFFTNAFEYYTKEGYKQTTHDYIEDLTTIEKPPVDLNMPSSDEISAVLDPNGKLNATYTEETNPVDAEYTWPFLIGKKGDYDCIYPSNKDKDNSYATIYINIELKDGEALVFDYFASSQIGQDILHVIVDRKDLYSISGISEDWESCCAYVANETKVYEVALCYKKDLADFSGDDAIYIKNLRIEDPNKLDIEAHIFRYAATEPNETNSDFNKYANVVYNPVDGYYHVGTADGPLLFAGLVGTYTKFDDEKSVFERFYAMEDASFMVNGVEKYNQFVMYGNLAGNSKMYGFVPVTQELKDCLVKYTEEFWLEVGKDYNENMWLQLCCYYDAYGKDVKHKEDPIKGLSTFSAYEAQLGEDNTVTYDTILVPRGHFYKFTPAVSGMYRVTSNSTSSVIGWIYTGESSEWANNDEFGYRHVYIDAEITERFNPALIKTDSDGKQYIDTLNVSMTAYMEAGKDYYIVIAYHTVEETGSFKFEIEKINDNLIPFVAAASGPYTFDLESGKLLAGSTCIDVVLNEADGLYYQKLADGTMGAPVYADFTYPTSVITNVSLLDMLNPKDAGGNPIDYNYFEFGMTSKEQEALQLLRLHGREGFAEHLGVDMLDEKFTEEYNKMTKVEDEDGNLVDRPESEINAFLAQYAEAGLRELWGSNYDIKWAEYGMDNVIACNYHPVDYTDVIQKYADMLENDSANAPERQGCVAVTKELAEALQAIVDNYGFFGVDSGWLKFCYFYNFDIADPAMKEQLK